METYYKTYSCYENLDAIILGENCFSADVRPLLNPSIKTLDTLTLLTPESHFLSPESTRQYAPRYGSLRHRLGVCPPQLHYLLFPATSTTGAFIIDDGELSIILKSIVLKPIILKSIVLKLNNNNNE